MTKWTLASWKTADSSAYEPLIAQIRANLTPDLLKPGYGGDKPTSGHCYVAAEAMYHMLGGQASGLKPMRMRMTNGDTHWWLKAPDGSIIDPTHDQFEDEIPYDLGKGGGFLTSQPSKRAQTLIARLEQPRFSKRMLAPDVKQRLTEQCEQLAGALNAVIVWRWVPEWFGVGDWKWGVNHDQSIFIKGGLITVPRIVNDMTYMIALHEIGHGYLHDEHGEQSKPESGQGVSFEAELWVDHWALEHALIPIDEDTLAQIRKLLDTYDSPSNPTYNPGLNNWMQPGYVHDVPNPNRWQFSPADYEQWDQIEQQHNRDAQDYFRRMGVFEQWTKTAADVRELARQMKVSLIGEDGGFSRFPGNDVPIDEIPARPDIQKWKDESKERRELAERGVRRPGADLDLTAQEAIAFALLKRSTGLGPAQNTLNEQIEYTVDAATSPEWQQAAGGRLQELFDDKQDYYKAIGGFLKKREIQMAPGLYRCLKEILEYMEQRHPESYKIWPWMVKQYKEVMKHKDFYQDFNMLPAGSMYNYGMDHFADVVGQGGALIQRLRAENRLPEGFDINKMSYEDLSLWVEEYQSANAGESYQEKNVVFNLDNGWTIQQVNSENDLEVEGELMGHCVGGYCSIVQSGGSLIYSLRNPNNLPHVTLEISGKRKGGQADIYGQQWNANESVDPLSPHEEAWQIVQIQGKSNKEPKDEYKAMLRQWFEALQAQGVKLERNVWEYADAYHIADARDLLDWEQENAVEGGWKPTHEREPKVDEYGIPENTIDLAFDAQSTVLDIVTKLISSDHYQNRYGYLSAGEIPDLVAGCLHAAQETDTEGNPMATLQSAIDEGHEFIMKEADKHRDNNMNWEYEVYNHSWNEEHPDEEFPDEHWDHPDLEYARNFVEEELSAPFSNSYAFLEALQHAINPSAPEPAAEQPAPPDVQKQINNDLDIPGALGKVSVAEEWLRPGDRVQFHGQISDPTQTYKDVEMTYLGIDNDLMLFRDDYKHADPHKFSPHIVDMWLGNGMMTINIPATIPWSNEEQNYYRTGAAVFNTIMAQKLRGQIEDLAFDAGVKVSYEAMPGRAHALSSGGKVLGIVIEYPVDEYKYFAALHELGHIYFRQEYGWDVGGGGGDSNTNSEEQELWAWHWGLEHSLVPLSQETLEEASKSLSTYDSYNMTDTPEEGVGWARPSDAQLRLFAPQAWENGQDIGLFDYYRYQNKLEQIGLGWLNG